MLIYATFKHLTAFYPHLQL